MCSCATFGIPVKPFGTIGYLLLDVHVLLWDSLGLESLRVPWAAVEFLRDSCGVLV